jgi:hypothetical protein
MLNAMGVDESTAKFVLIQTKNKGVEEALDYLDRLGEREVQAELNKYQASINSANTKKKRKPKYIPLELQRLFSELQLINRCTVSTNGKLPSVNSLSGLCFSHMFSNIDRFNHERISMAEC